MRYKNISYNLTSDFFLELFYFLAYIFRFLLFGVCFNVMKNTFVSSKFDYLNYLTKKLINKLQKKTVVFRIYFGLNFSS